VGKNPLKPLETERNKERKPAKTFETGRIKGRKPAKTLRNRENNREKIG